MLRQLFFVWCIAWTLVVPHAGADETPRVAAISPLSGTFAHIGEETIKQLKGAADLINAKGGIFDGRKIEIVALDGKANAQDSLLALNQAIDGGMHYVVAHISSVNHQLVAPLYLARLTKVGEAGVKFDVENTGLGWKTVAKAEGKDAVPPIKCTVERPSP